MADRFRGVQTLASIVLSQRQTLMTLASPRWCWCRWQWSRLFVLSVSEPAPVVEV